MDIHLDMDWPVQGSCKYYCYPSCHPGQVFDKPVYGCTHIAWPTNQGGGFCHIVDCKGKTGGCEIPWLFLTKSEEMELGIRGI